MEREKLEGELQEEKKALNDKLKEQERKIVNLSTMVISSAGDDFNQPYQKVCWRGGYALMLTPPSESLPVYSIPYSEISIGEGVNWIFVL